LTPEAIKAEREKSEPSPKYKAAAEYGTIGLALGGLDHRVRVLLEAAWEKVRKGE
jgi:hypothetical protein